MYIIETITNYYKLTILQTTITKYFWIYLHPKDAIIVIAIIVIAVVGVGAHAARWRFGGA
jgi:hypothetical protein